MTGQKVSHRLRLAARWLNMAPLRNLKTWVFLFSVLLLVHHKSFAQEASLSNIIVTFFDLTNLSRSLGVDAESALREANTRFEQWFRAAEQKQVRE